MISVLMSVYNGEKLLPNSIESILSQTYSDFEFLILNDGSIDRTESILNKFRDLDDRIKIFKNEKNLGLTKSLNQLINISSGQIIARQDHDDVSLKNRFNNQIKFMKEKKLDACTTRALVEHSNKKIPGLSSHLPIKLIMKYKNPFIHGTLMIKSEILKKVGSYNENFYYAQDYMLYKTLIKDEYKIKQLNKVEYILNQKNNISTIFKDEQKKYFIMAKKS